MANLSVVLWLDRCKRSILATFGHKLLLDFWITIEPKYLPMIHWFLQIFFMGSCSATFRSLRYHPHKPIKKESALLVHGETFMLVLFPILVPIQLLQKFAYPKKSIKQISQVEARGLECYSNFLVVVVEESASKFLRAFLLCQSQQIWCFDHFDLSVLWNCATCEGPRIFPLPSETLRHPAQWIPLGILHRPWQRLPGAQLVPSTFWSAQQVRHSPSDTSSSKFRRGLFSNSSSLEGLLRTWIWLSFHPVLEDFLNLFHSRSSAALSSGIYKSLMTRNWLVYWAKAEASNMTLSTMWSTCCRFSFPTCSCIHCFVLASNEVELSFGCSNFKSGLAITLK